MSSSLIGILVLALLLVRTFIPRAIGGKPTLPVVLLAIGLVDVARTAQAHPFGVRDVLLLLASLSLGILIATARAFTTRIWRENGTAMSRGTWRTALLWLVAMAQHIGVGLLMSNPAVDSSATLAYMGVVLLAQRLVLVARARAAGLQVGRHGDETRLAR